MPTQQRDSGPSVPEAGRSFLVGPWDLSDLDSCWEVVEQRVHRPHDWTGTSGVQRSCKGFHSQLPCPGAPQCPECAP